MGPFSIKQLSIDFAQSLMILFLTGERVSLLNVFFKSQGLKPSTVVFNNENFFESYHLWKTKPNRTH